MSVSRNLYRIFAFICLSSSIPVTGLAAQTKDLNGDSIADLVWVKSDTGSVNIWLGGNPTNTISLTVFEQIFQDPEFSGYKVTKVGNYLYNDGQDFVLIGGTPLKTLPIDSRSLYAPICVDFNTLLATKGDTHSTTCGSNPWQLIGVEDFDGNPHSGEDQKKHDELLWWSSSLNRPVLWFVVSTGKGSSQFFYSVFKRNKVGWTPKAVLDFDKNGKTDIIWMNPLGDKLVLWKTKKLTPAKTEGKFNIITSVTPLPKPPNNRGYQFLTAANLTNDEWVDLVWKDANNQVIVWPMKKSQKLKKNLSIQISDATHSISADDEIVSTGDFDGDGHTDLVWQNKATANLSIWYTQSSSGSTLTVREKVGPLSPPAGTGWELIN